MNNSKAILESEIINIHNNNIDLSFDKIIRKSVKYRIMLKDILKFLGLD